MRQTIHQKIMDLLNPGYPKPLEGKEKALEYILSIGLDSLSDSEESNNENKLITLINRVKQTNSKLGKDLLNPNLFKSFITNKVKINPKVSNDWFINYTTADVNNGYMTITSSDQHIRRVPIFKFFDLLNNGTVDENGNQSPISIIGNRLQGNFIINNQREIYSDHFYNIWKQVHGLDRTIPQNTQGIQNLKKEDLVPGRVYKTNITRDSLDLERFLGYKYIIKYQIFNGELIPKITRLRIAISIHLTKFNLMNNTSEQDYGFIKKLSPLKKLIYHEDLNDLPFIQKLSPDLELVKIKNSYKYMSNFVDVLDELPAPKSKLGFKLELTQPNELANVIKLNGKYLFSSNSFYIRNENITFRPNAVLLPDVNNIGKFKYHPLNTHEQFQKFGIPTEQLNINVRVPTGQLNTGQLNTTTEVSSTYTLKVTPIVEKGIRLNIVDDIID